MSYILFTSKLAEKSGAIVAAGCGSLADSMAMTRWLLAELQDWPGAAWHCWIVDAVNCEAVRAAKVQDPDSELDWQDIEDSGIEPGHVVCRIIGGRCGLIILADDGAATAAVRALAGLVTGLTCFPANDPLAYPLRKSFASYGASAGI